MSRQQLEAYLLQEGVNDIQVVDNAIDLLEVAAAARAKGYDVTDDDVMTADNSHTILVGNDATNFLKSPGDFFLARLK